jgi:hypothetical protein
MFIKAAIVLDYFALQCVYSEINDISMPVCRINVNLQGRSVSLVYSGNHIDVFEYQRCIVIASFRESRSLAFLLLDIFISLR